MGSSFRHNSGLRAQGALMRANYFFTERTVRRPVGNGDRGKQVATVYRAQQARAGRQFALTYPAEFLFEDANSKHNERHRDQIFDHADHDQSHIAPPPFNFEGLPQGGPLVGMLGRA
jgi:hypothetical protein